MKDTIIIPAGETIAAPAAPSLDDMISGASSSDTSNGGNAALDNLTIRIDDAPSNGTASPSGDPPRRRGRPPGSGARQPDSGKSTRKSKADVEAELERVKSELAAERARNNQAAVAELSEQVKMAAFLAFGAAAETRGAHWGMTEPEADSIGKTFGLALAPHADTMRKYAPWTMAAAALGGALFKRVREDQRLIALHGVARADG